MGGPRVLLGLVALGWLVTACADHAGDVPTTPSFARPVRDGCDFNAVNSLVRDEFGASSTESGLATDMKNYGSKTAQGTYVGFRLLDALGVKYDIAANQSSTFIASQLAAALLPCMIVGSSTLPTSFAAELGPTGAFGVRGWPGDTRPVESHELDDAKPRWILEPPQGKTWADISLLETASELPDSVEHLLLAYGQPVSSTGFTGDSLVGDEKLFGNVFDWNTLPVADFVGGVIVGECNLESNYIQHNRANDNPEVLGFVAPSCAVDAGPTLSRTDGLVDRLIGFFAPKPLHAALLTTTGTGGGKSKLSPFGLIYPDSVNLQALFEWKKSGSTVGAAPLQTKDGGPPKYRIRSGSGTVFLQDFVLVWLTAIGNQGTNVAICNNYAYTNSQGIAHFPAAYLNKAGGYTIIAQTKGTVSNDPVDGGDAPVVPAGVSLSSPIVNVKNGTLGDCDNIYNGEPEFPPSRGPNGIAPLE